MGNLWKAIGIRYFGGYVLYDIPRSRRVGRAHVGVWMGVWMGVAVLTAVDKGSRDVLDGWGGMLASIQTTLGLVFRESQTVHFRHPDLRQNPSKCLVKVLRWRFQCLSRRIREIFRHVTLRADILCSSASLRC